MAQKVINEQESLQETVTNGVLSHNYWARFAHCLHQLARAKLVHQQALARKHKKTLASVILAASILYFFN